MWQSKLEDPIDVEIVVTERCPSITFQVDTL